MLKKHTIEKTKIIGPVAAALLASVVLAAPAYARGMHMGGHMGGHMSGHTGGHMSGHMSGAPHFSGRSGGNWNGGGNYAYRGGHHYHRGGHRYYGDGGFGLAFGWGGGPYWDYPYYASDCYVRRVWRHHHLVWRRYCDY
ncbi:MAG: hypothetical protein ACREB8_00080 [Pseudolabrys sp.]